MFKKKKKTAFDHLSKLTHKEINNKNLCSFCFNYSSMIVPLQQLLAYTGSKVWEFTPSLIKTKKKKEKSQLHRLEIEQTANCYTGRRVKSQLSARGEKQCCLNMGITAHGDSLTWTFHVVHMKSCVKTEKREDLGSFFTSTHLAWGSTKSLQSRNRNPSNSFLRYFTQNRKCQHHGGTGGKVGLNGMKAQIMFHILTTWLKTNLDGIKLLWWLRTCFFIS